jgi:hypothetical protein
VPTTHVDQTAGAAIKAYIAGTANPTASLAAGVKVKTEAPAVADFSSRGPAIAGTGDLLKPDLAAPGVDVIAAVSPENHAGNLWDAESGTSMAAPHIAGIAALLRSKNPTWTPMQIKSALMTTAGQLDNQGKPIQAGAANGTPLDFGAGHIRPANAFDPGLVYDSGPIEWFQYACGIGQHIGLLDENGNTVDVCTIVGTIDPSDLNYPSISIGDLVDKQTITRTVTNIASLSSTYLARVTAPAGTTVKVTPPVLVVAPGKTATYKVEITRTNAALGAWSFGSLIWTDLRGHNVRSPISIRPVALAAPAETIQSGTSGSAALSVRPGYNGVLTATPFGLAAGAVTSSHLVGTNANFRTAAPAAGPAVAKVTATVPSGQKVTRFATFAGDYGEGADLDMFAYQAGTATLVMQSAGGTADEAFDLAPGTYDIYVVQFALPAGVTEQDVKLNYFQVGSGPPANLTVSPASQPAVSGRPVTVTATWSGLSAGQHYMGVVEYGDGSTVRGRTVLTVNG